MTESAPPPALDEDRFRTEVRSFLDNTLPRKGSRAPRPGDALTWAKDYQRQLAAAGLAGITWPPEYGGRGLPTRFEQLFEREAVAYERPPRALDIGLGMCGPTLLAHASDEQKRRFIPPLLRGDHVWCELFSEPGAGSDLASVQTRAELDGESWVVHGQKVWTSGAQHADFGMCLTRTDADRTKRDGITMMIVDMSAQGVTVQPLRQMTGDARFNEVFLDAVRVPSSHVVGGVHDGWRVARTMLAFERQTLGAMGSGGGGRGGVGALVTAAQERGMASRSEIRQPLADLRARQMLLRHLGRSLAAKRVSGGGDAATLKLVMAGLVQDVAEVGTQIAGPDAIAWDAYASGADRWSDQLLNARSASIGGGTNEVLRNLIAERALGLPRDVEADADVPFRQLKVGTQRDE